MNLCPICESRLASDACPSCQKELQDMHVKMLAEGGFKLKAWPESGIAPPEKLKTLRTALLKESWMVAEYEWLKLARGTLGSDEAARSARARCFEKLAFLLEGLTRETEANHMRARAASLLKLPAAPLPKAERRNASFSFMEQIQEEEGSKPHISEEAQKRLDATLAKSESREKTLKVVACGAAGLVGGAIVGMNATLIGGVLGVAAGAGWILMKR